MPIRLDIKKKLTQRSDRVKSVDMHPVEPWVLCALYSGNVVIYNYQLGTTVKMFEVSELPVRCAKFIARKQWIICGSDDMQLRVFNYNTQERIAQFEGHQDYVRYLEVHPSQPYILTSSDDMQVKLWDWEKSWACMQTYEGHAHYVMMVRINPKDTNTFVTASLDRSVKVWSLSSPTPNFSLEGHERGVNCVDYYPGGDKPYIVSGADDFTLRLWDYQTRSCVATLEGHTNNVCAVVFHARLPLIISGGEDGTVRVWHNTTYRLESTLNYGFERSWALAASPVNNKVAIGYDDGTIVVKLGSEVPVASMDKNGKLVVARNNVIYSSSVRAVSAVDDGEGGAAASAPSAAHVDGEPISLSEREMGSVELFPQTVAHNANGRFLVVSGDNEYVIYTAQALRNKSFGQALDFVWSAYGTGNYAVRESTSRVKIFKDFKETAAFKPGIPAEGIFGGALLGVRSADTVVFYDWDSAKVVRRIEVGGIRSIYWNETGSLVTIATDESYFVLRFSRDAYASGVEAATGAAEAAAVAEEGVEAAFELQHETPEKVRNGLWVGDVFLYTNGANRLNYYVGGEVMTLAHLDRHMYMLGYLAKEGRVYLTDKSGAVVSYALLLAMVEYQTAVVRRDFAAANRILPDIPRDLHNSVAKFLEGQGFKEQALEVAEDPDLKFDLAVQLNKLDVAYKLLRAVPAADSDGVDAQSKWKALADLALARSNLALAEECALAARDASTLLLIYSSTGNAAGMARVAEMAREDGRGNLAFVSSLVLGRVDDCTALLTGSGRLAEAAFFARTYAPSALAKVMPAWRADAAKHSKRAAEALAEPPAPGGAPSELFPDFDLAIKAETTCKGLRTSAPTPASAYLQAKADLSVDLIAFIKEALAAPPPAPAPAPAVEVPAALSPPKAAVSSPPAPAAAAPVVTAAPPGPPPAVAAPPAPVAAPAPAPQSPPKAQPAVVAAPAAPPLSAEVPAIQPPHAFKPDAPAAVPVASAVAPKPAAAPLAAPALSAKVAPPMPFVPPAPFVPPTSKPLVAPAASAASPPAASPVKAAAISPPQAAPASQAAAAPKPAPAAAPVTTSMTAAQLAAELDEFEVSESDWA